jgi:hypothetical protein
MMVASPGTWHASPPACPQQAALTRAAAGKAEEAAAAAKRGLAVGGLHGESHGA